MKNQEILQLLYGPPHPDGYGSTVVQFNTNVKEINLGRNSMYTLQFRHGDGYFGVIDGYEFDNTVTDILFGDESDSSITDSSATLYAADGDDFDIMTNDKHYVLSVKRPDGSIGATEVRIVKRQKGGFLFGKHRK